MPAIDLVETEGDLSAADLPGLSEKDVEIEFENDVLTISGSRKSSMRSAGTATTASSAAPARFGARCAARGGRPRGGQGDVRPRRARDPRAQARAAQAPQGGDPVGESPKTIDGADGEAPRQPDRPTMAATRVWRSRPGSPVVKAARGRQRSAQDPRVPQRVAPGLGPHAQPVRTLADRDRGPQTPRRGVDRVDDGVVAAAQPQRAARRPRRRPCRGWRAEAGARS